MHHKENCVDACRVSRQMAIEPQGSGPGFVSGREQARYHDPDHRSCDAETYHLFAALHESEGATDLPDGHAGEKPV